MAKKVLRWEFVNTYVKMADKRLDTERMSEEKEDAILEHRDYLAWMVIKLQEKRYDEVDTEKVYSSIRALGTI